MKMDLLSEDQAVGMLVGLAVGDALGAPLEFTRARNPANYLTEMVGGGAHRCRVGEWTDDTAMALAIADSYLKVGEFDASHIAKNFSLWLDGGYFGTRDYCFDVGFTCSSGIRFAERSNFERPYTGMGTPDSAGNGALMRMAPVILANVGCINDALVDAVRQTIMTHAGNEVIGYSQQFALELFSAGQYLDSNSLRLPASTEREQVMSGGYVKETYQCAWWAIMNSSNFEDALVLAINRGHDTDTVGAVTGQLAGVIYGYSGIPIRWLKDLLEIDKIKAIALQLFEIGKQEGNKKNIKSTRSPNGRLTTREFNRLNIDKGDTWFRRGIKEILIHKWSTGFYCGPIWASLGEKAKFTVQASPYINAICVEIDSDNREIVFEILDHNNLPKKYPKGKLIRVHVEDIQRYVKLDARPDRLASQNRNTTKLTDKKFQQWCSFLDGLDN